MNNEEIQRFNAAVKSDSAMQAEVTAIGNDLDKLVAYANSKGYSFSEEDVKEVAGRQDLTDEDLDEVAGGEAGVVAFVVVRAAFI